MKNYFSTLILFLSLSAFSQSKVDTIRNSTIIKLTKSKLAETVIIQKINQSYCIFDVGIDSLIALKDNNVTDNIINVMIAQNAKQEKVNAEKQQNANDKNYVFEESGIYFQRGDKYISLDPTIANTSKPKSGLFNVKLKSQIEGSEANYQLSQKRPEFYFNFEPVKKDLNDANANNTQKKSNNYMDELLSKSPSGYGLANSSYQAISPNDFKLIKLDKSNKRREFTSGKVNMVGQFDWSIDDKSIINFKYEKISANTYKITFPKDLNEGEYCFFYLGNNTNQNMMYGFGQNNFKVFDFGIKNKF